MKSKKERIERVHAELETPVEVKITSSRGHDTMTVSAADAVALSKRKQSYIEEKIFSFSDQLDHLILIRFTNDFYNFGETSLGPKLNFRYKKRYVGFLKFHLKFFQLV